MTIVWCWKLGDFATLLTVSRSGSAEHMGGDQGQGYGDTAGQLWWQVYI